MAESVAKWGDGALLFTFLMLTYAVLIHLG
jgi:hypothetical protein